MRVRVEHRDDALGLGTREPRLSWQLPADAREQLAYELALDDGHSTGWVTSRECVLHPWPGMPLASGERRAVRVRVRTDLGETDWSEWTHLEAGLLDPGDWKARWIRPDEPDDLTPGFRPAFALRGTIEVPADVVSARLHVTAHGLAETSIDGRPVSDEVLAPGFTEYAQRVQVRTHDVTELLTPGPHEVTALLADGWYRGSVGVARSTDQWGTDTAYLAQLHLTTASGEPTVWGTGPHWQSALSAILAADLIEGERVDLRLTPGPWGPVRTADEIGYAGLTPSPAPPVRRVAEIGAVSITEPVAGRQVVDLGQEINGWLRLGNLGPAGTTLTLTHGEALTRDGDVTTDHLIPDMPFLAEPLRAGQVDTVTAAGLPGEVFEPRFTTHGFRYVRVEGHPETLRPEDVAGVVVHTDLRETGSFACSNPDLDALHAAAVWSFRGNACDVPTDCPTRERAAWTGDWLVYAPVATFHHDVAGFSTKWLRDLAGAQWDNGILGNMAPMPRAERTGFLAGLNGSAGWGDAIVEVPWELWSEYGDRDLLAATWPAMVRWLDFAERTAREHRHPDRIAARPTPAAHEEWLWDTGFHWGEWLEPGAEPHDFPAFVAADKSIVATAHLARSARLMARIAAVLERPEDEARYAALAASATAAWQAEFIGPEGVITPTTQANLVRALALDLLPDDLRQVTADRLADLAAANGDRLSTGFLSTRHLLPVLADHGHLDTAYRLLLQREEPSWLAMLDRGATTMWEHWDGIDAERVPRGSLNHYSKGAVIGFLHGWVAGLRRTEPTWRRSLVAPRPGGGVTWARAHHDSPHGRHAVDWSLTRDRFEVTIVVPPGCVTDLALPDGTSEPLGPGTHRRTTRVATR